MDFPPQTTPEKGAALDVQTLKRWLRDRFRLSTARPDPARDGDSLEDLLARNGQAHDLLHDSLVMLMAARHPETAPADPTTDSKGGPDEPH